MNRKVVLVAACLVLAGLVALALAAWRAGGVADRFAPRVEEALARRLGGALSAESTEVEGLGRIVLRGISHESGGPRGRLTMSADRLVVEPRLLALVAGRVELDRVELDAPALVLRRPAPLERTEPAAPPPTPPRPAKAPVATERTAEPEERRDARLDLEVGALVVRDASVVVVGGDGGEELRLEGLALDLRDVVVRATGEGPAARVEQLAATGRASADVAATPAGVARELDTEVTIDHDEVRLAGLRHESAVGAAEGELTLSLATLPPRALSGTLSFPRFDLDELVGRPDGAATPAARASLRVEIEGSGPALGAPRGRGELQVEAGRLPDFPLLAGVERSLQRLSLRDASHDPVVARFELGPDGARLEPFVVRAADVEAEVAGAIALDGALDLEIVLRADRDRVDLRGAPAVVVEAMTFEPGRVVLPLRIGGTAAEPRVTANVEEMARAARAAGRDIDTEVLRREVRQLFAG